MSTITGNKKISELSILGEIDNGKNLRIPLSKNNGTTDSPNWKSYCINGDVLSRFLENSLGINDVGNEDGIRTKISKLQEITNEYIELERELGKYNINSISDSTKIRLNINIPDYYVSTDGVKVNNSEYCISNEVSLKQGYLYLLNIFDFDIFNSYPSDIALMAKVHHHTYKNSNGSTAEETTYEPLPTHYRSIANNGYGAPDSKYLVFFATEDMDVVVSGKASIVNNGLYAIKYGAFIEIADKLLTLNGEMMKVLVEAIVKNKKDIESLYERTTSLGDIHVTSIDSDEYPTVQGEPMVVVSDREPSTGTSTRGDDLPNRIGQIWVKENGKAYIAVKLGMDGWKELSFVN